jgi:MFS family permease
MAANPDATETRDASLIRALAHRDFRLIWSAQILSELGDWAARVALAVLVYNRTGSKVLTATVTAVSMLPWVGLGQALAALADRFPRRTVMVISDLIRAATFLAMTAVRPAWALLVLAFVAAAATPPFEAARAAAVTESVPEDVYGDALTISNVTYQAVLVLGYLFGGGMVAVLGEKTALMVNAGTFASSGVLIAMIRSGRIARPGQTVVANIKAALRVILRDPFLRRAVAIAVVGAAGAIVGEALVTVYVRENLPGKGAGVIGAFAATIPLGTIVASLLVRRKGDHTELLRTSALVVLLGSAGAITWFLISPPNYYAAAGYFSIGIAFAMVIPTYAVIGPRIPEQVRATTFSVLQGMLLGSQAIAAILGGALAIGIGPGPAAAFALFPALGYALYAFLVPPGGRFTIFPRSRRRASVSTSRSPRPR